MARKAFTVAEANATLPLLEGIFERVEALKQEAGHHHEKLQVLDALWGRDLNRPTNPDHEEFSRRRRLLQQIPARIQALVEKEILPLGVRFPAGGLELGLIDFPTTYQGRWVFLCWQRGESQLEFWHEIEAGYAGRQPILDEHLISMGREDDPDTIDASGLDF